MGELTAGYIGTALPASACLLHHTCTHVPHSHLYMHKLTVMHAMTLIINHKSSHSCPHSDTLTHMPIDICFTLVCAGTHSCTHTHIPHSCIYKYSHSGIHTLIFTHMSALALRLTHLPLCSRAGTSACAGSTSLPSAPLCLPPVQPCSPSYWVSLPGGAGGSAKVCQHGYTSATLYLHPRHVPCPFSTPQKGKARE